MTELPVTNRSNSKTKMKKENETLNYTKCQFVSKVPIKFKLNKLSMFSIAAGELLISIERNACKILFFTKKKKKKKKCLNKNKNQQRKKERKLYNLNSII